MIGGIGCGWYASAADIVIDLGEETDVLADFTVVMREGNWGITGANKAEYFVSSDKKSWTAVGTVTKDEAVSETKDEPWVERSFLLQLAEATTGRYVKIKLSGAGMNWVWLCEAAVWKYYDAPRAEAHVYSGTEAFTNLMMTNDPAHPMGDCDDAPAYCVYSEKGYNKAKMTVELSNVDVQTVSDDGTKSVAAYIFLGVSVCKAGGWWLNNADAGLVYGGEIAGWHLFWATATDENGQRGWCSDGKTLDPTRDYVLELDNSATVGSAVISVYDAATGELADSMEFKLYGSETDGAKTSFYTDVALDWATEATKVDSNGNATSDWAAITRAVYGHGIHMTNVGIYACELYKDGESFEWTTDRTLSRGLWCDASAKLGLETTLIYSVTGDTEYKIDLDLG